MIRKHTIQINEYYALDRVTDVDKCFFFSFPSPRSHNDVFSLKSLLHPVDVGFPLLEVLGRSVVRGPDGLADKQAQGLDVVLRENVARKNRRYCIWNNSGNPLQSLSKSNESYSREYLGIQSESVVDP